MKRSIIKLAGFCIAVISLTTSCESWLDVSQDDQILDKQAFSTEPGIRTAANGLYMTMGQDKLYGRLLSVYTTELMAQQFYSNPTHTHNDFTTRRNLRTYAYNQDTTKTHFAAIWGDSYNFILNVNSFISNMTASEGVVTQQNKNLMLGEAYALRAYMHFDILRLFGPMYAIDSTNTSIPYYTVPDGNREPRLPANMVMDNILRDINTALSYLQDDPVKTGGSNYPPTVTGGELNYYTQGRNQHLNYYAVQALKARILLYRGNTTAAGDVAISTIREIESNSVFPWVTPEEINKSRKEDRIFSPEVLFAVYAQDLYKTFDQLLSSSLGDLIGLYTHIDKINALYAPDVTTNGDYRSNNWQVYQNPDFAASNKYRKPVDPTHFLNLVPLIRKSELYYIATEATGDLSYLNEVREHRNIRPIASTTNLTEDLRQEYQRETVLEGQLFYFYKRNSYAQIPGANDPSIPVNMSASTYVVPLPDKEIDL